MPALTHTQKVACAHSKLMTLVSLPGAGPEHKAAELETISESCSEVSGRQLSHASQREAYFLDGRGFTKLHGPDHGIEAENCDSWNALVSHNNKSEGKIIKK